MNGELMDSPAYWNNIVYFSPDGAPMQSFQLSNGLLSPLAQSAKTLIGASSPAVSANGNTNGILWVISGTLNAYDAVTLQSLYASTSNVPKRAHFATPTVANGRVYIATQNSLEAYGLLNVLSIANGNNQTAQVLNALTTPLQVRASNPYTGQPEVGYTVTFSDGNKGGTFNPPSAVTDSNGLVSTVYTFPKVAGPYNLTASSPNFSSVTATAMASPGAVTRLIAISGSRQSGSGGTVLPSPLVMQAQDAYKNPVPGVTITFKPVTQGSTNPVSVVTDAKGKAQTFFELPSGAGNFSVTASTPSVKGVTFPETSTGQ
jgi:hypothetical protein